VLRNPENPFELYVPWSIRPQPYIRFERDMLSPVSPAPLLMAHDDFRGLVTPQDPASPGETVHIFAMNLGPVDRPVATGEPGPANPPARATLAFACYLFEIGGPRGIGAEVPFAGLTGGVAGVYHIDVTIPADWRAGESLVACRSGETGDAGSFTVSGVR
jgi:uncharacterized protein (TIGR03437 family)